MTYRKERDRNLLVVGRWSWIGLLSFACGVSLIKSGRGRSTTYGLEGFCMR
ncbi:hypothetical protein [Bacillus salacetis]|uniref:hypothetical protein n=1 Tax=Bacillus salacetis TaxID=2315464 RepID=UPI0014445AE6|nr:hypothetical protein [Bacillus salacetis]